MYIRGRDEIGNNHQTGDRKRHHRGGLDDHHHAFEECGPFENFAWLDVVHDSPRLPRQAEPWQRATLRNSLHPNGPATDAQSRANRERSGETQRELRTLQLRRFVPEI